MKESCFINLGCELMRKKLWINELIHDPGVRVAVQFDLLVGLGRGNRG